MTWRTAIVHKQKQLRPLLFALKNGDIGEKVLFALFLHISNLNLTFKGGQYSMLNIIQNQLM